MAYEYEFLQVSVDAGVLTATISAPPMNVMVVGLARDLAGLSRDAAADDSVRVVVLQSADPDFFIAHFDVSAILEFPTDGPAERPTEVGGFHGLCERYRTMPKPTICKIAGRIGGGGSELAASCDMRFGVLERTIVNQMEVPLGILPGGTGTQRLHRLLGRGRAMEVVLGGIDLDAATAERWGYLNRAFPTVEELDSYVDDLARRIAGFPAPAVAAAKAAVLAAGPDPTEGLLEESFLFQQVLRTPEAQAAMRRFLELGGQTREVELRMGEIATELTPE